MTVNANNARIFGSDRDAVWVAPHGTDISTIELDTDLSAIPAFTDAGWLHTDGIPFTPSDSVTRHRGHQGGRVVRSVITESGLAFQFQCLETTALSIGLQHNIKEKTVTGGVARMRASAGRKIERRVFVIDLYDIDDDDIHYRYIVEVGEVGERQEVAHTNADITGYTFPVEVIGDYVLLTNDPALIEAEVGANGAFNISALPLEGDGVVTDSSVAELDAQPTASADATTAKKAAAKA